jgi:putative membrane protein
MEKGSEDPERIILLSALPFWRAREFPEEKLPFAPTLNAILNASSAFFLACGYVMIRRRRIPAHRICMLSAFACSTAFLVSYILYHLQAGVIRFAGQGWIRPVYFTLLGTHTVLAAAIVPLALVTLSRALAGRFDRHRHIARWTLPVWLYVSVTGVVIYFMLYHVHTGPGP